MRRLRERFTAWLAGAALAFAALLPGPMHAAPPPSSASPAELAAAEAALGALAKRRPPAARATPAAPAAPRPTSEAAKAAATAAALAAAPRAPRTPVVSGEWVHALTAYGLPKYPRGFASYRYVDPDAPKGGTLRLGNADRRSSFDKFNPFTVKGVAQASFEMFLFDRLCDFAMDEPQTMYGLLAEEMRVEPDLSAITFRLHPLARFSNGDAVTADDVAHSYRQLTGPLVQGNFKTPLLGVERAVVVDARTVRFELKQRSIDSLFALGHMPVFSHKWGGGKPLADIVTEQPIASGPYVISKAEMPSRLEYTRRGDYWAQHLGVRRGMFNFDRIAYRLYKDDAVRREAFKAGEFDLLREIVLGQFYRAHRGPKWDDGRIVKHSFELDNGNMLQAFDFNLRRSKFQDIRVREAIMRAFDFEAVSRYPGFTRANSVFNNSEFAAVGPPGADELALLEPFRAELPAQVFGPAFVAPRYDDGRALRQSLKRAAQLLSEAGWNIAADGVLRNANGEAFEMEYMEPQRVGRFPEFELNLKKLGIRYTERLVDFALYRRRLENYDFDLVIILEGKFTLPNPGHLESIYGSAQADQPGGQNYRGVKSRAADALIDKMKNAATLAELRSAARAFDRVVMWNHWQVPQYTKASENASYWNRFGMPRVQARYMQVDSIPSEHSLPWPLWTWWDRAVDKRAAAALPATPLAAASAASSAGR